MRLEQLMYLVAVNESKSISLAAERSHISQPALSSAISKLEDELGVVLLKRTNSGAYLTDVGELIIVKAKEVLSGIDDIKAIAHGNSLVLNGNISIAADPGVNITIMPDILTTFKYNHPKVNVLLKVGESNNILQDIEKGKADFGIILSTDAFRKSKDMQSIELFADEFVVITGSNRKLASESTITLKRALSLPILLYNTEYITECGVSSLLQKHGSFNVSYRVDNLEMMEKILTQGEAIAFVPKFMADEYMKTSKIKKIPLSDARLDVSVVLIWSDRHHLCMIEKEFIRVIRATCSRKAEVRS
ncbi:LysR family transcriptional regulator [Desulfitobacterium sp. LBE]|uniref:HTH lysR-type domain-containing protein n=4 Tax=Desulfitobacterium hafniense TaxID=49338 RepID=Q24ME1_DESHY|nr:MULTISPECIES: LysR family transcriptional regulator [Desulfitobacterium]ACL22905.1 transcriptional regulator, LysR family [Desulfitobacterium hafniense DCB-2]EHL05172.1 LysR substrate binding domain protein [Desulfitobacterium hafniense DP7]KTE93466.1 transcriptional regulator [Desulfitobacterium hafniense]TWH59064.1 LysR family transcriptional regulator [Desulfitobacterium sp. LBE]CDX05169.1 Transcriptional regulator [Desulfitobacterium hafniense]